MELTRAMELIEAVKASFVALRNNSEKEFRIVYSAAEQLAKQLGVTLSAPRVTKVQRHRANFETNSCENYYRISVWVPFLDFLINEMDARFPKEVNNVFKNLSILLPNNIVETSSLDFPDVVEKLQMYKEDISMSQLEGELHIWKALWKNDTGSDENERERPHYAMEAFKRAECVPNIQTLLKILVLLPITSCTAERSFSTLRRVKTYLRSTTGEERLNGLTIMNVERDVSFTPEEVLQAFSTQHPRRMQLSL